MRQSTKHRLTTFADFTPSKRQTESLATLSFNQLLSHDMDNVLGSLYIGNIDDAHDPPPIITALLWTALESKLQPPPNIVLGRIPLREYTEAVPMDIEFSLEWLINHLPKHQILVACREGKGRSVSVVIAYLCCIQGMSFDEAVAFVSDRRQGVTPLPRLEQTIEKVQEKRKNQDNGCS